MVQGNFTATPALQSSLFSFALPAKWELHLRRISADPGTLNPISYKPLP